MHPLEEVESKELTRHYLQPLLGKRVRFKGKICRIKRETMKRKSKPNQDVDYLIFVIENVKIDQCAEICDHMNIKLHPTQLTEEMVDIIKSGKLKTHNYYLTATGLVSHYRRMPNEQHVMTKDYQIKHYKKLQIKVEEPQKGW